MNYFKALTFLLLSISLSSFAKENIKTQDIKEGTCSNFNFDSILVTICNRSESQLKNLLSDKTNLYYDPEGRNTLYAIQEIAHNFGSNTASKLLAPNLDMQERFKNKWIGFIALDRNGCVLRYDLKKENLFTPCSSIKYDLSGRALVSDDDRVIWNLVFVPLHEEKSILKLKLNNKKYNFFPELYINSFTKKEKIKYALKWGKLEIIRKNLNRQNINNILDSAGNTALHIALVGNQENIIPTVNYLLKLGSDINKKNKNGVTPLELANLSNIETLIDIFTIKAHK